MNGKGNKTMTDKPMNLYATEDFQNAVKSADDKLKEIAEKLKGIRLPLTTTDDFPCISFDDLEPEFCGTMRLKTSDMWERITDYLTDAGYEVTIRKEDATETEEQLDGVSKWVVIEYGEVER